MKLVDQRNSIEAKLDLLAVQLKKRIAEYETLIESNSGCQQTNTEERFNSVTFFFIHNAFAAICELKNNIEKRNIISSMLITRHLMELYSDFKFLISNPTKQNEFANAFYYFGEMRNIVLNTSISDADKEKAKANWKKYKQGKNNLHWSGISRTEIVRKAWGEESTIYGTLSAHCHVSLLTQDLVFWTYSERAYGYISANVDGSLGMVDEILTIAKQNKLCGCVF